MIRVWIKNDYRRVSRKRFCTRMSMDWWLNRLLSMGKNRSLRRFILWCMICHWNSMQSSLNLLSYHQAGSVITGFHWKKALNQSILDHRHSHSQKDVIEKLVKKMLDSSIIQVSHNPFSSPVLLVQKNDNTWRFCELYSDEWFSKIDI